MLVFFGTSPRSAKFLELAIQNGCKFDMVVSEPAKLIGRKQVLTENPTVIVAKKNNIPYLLYLNELHHQKNLIIGVILDYNKIIPNIVIDLFDEGIINIHFSKLPKYRGPAPVQYSILNGDKEAWISYYLISEKLDEGKIIKQTSLPLDFTENTESLYQKLIEKSAGEIKEIVSRYLEKEIVSKKQEGEPSLTKKLKTENCKIDWTKTPVEIERLIRASYPEPGAWTFVILSASEGSRRDSSPRDDGVQNDNNKRLKILKAHLENNLLILDLVQLEGKNPVTYEQFKQGYPEAKIK